MGVDKGYFVFDRPDPVFNTGEVINGKFVSEEEGTDSEATFVQLTGFSEVTIPARKGNTRTVYKKQTLCDVRSNLESHDKEKTFEIRIPSNIPSSFKGPHGRVVYQLKVAVAGPVWFEQRSCVTISVTNVIDLNAYPTCKQPIQAALCHEYKTWPYCKSQGWFTLNVYIPVSGFSPGQTMHAAVNCDNDSPIKVPGIRLRLIEETTYEIGPNTASVKKILKDVFRGPIRAGEIVYWAIALEIPAVYLPNLYGCKHIFLKHWLEMKIISPCFHCKNKTSRAMMLGHIPLAQAVAPENQNTAGLIQSPSGNGVNQNPSGNGVPHNLSDNRINQNPPASGINQNQSVDAINKNPPATIIPVNYNLSENRLNKNSSRIDVTYHTTENRINNYASDFEATNNIKETRINQNPPGNIMNQNQSGIEK